MAIQARLSALEDSGLSRLYRPPNNDRDACM
jgi:hypothetical protein